MRGSSSCKSGARLAVPEENLLNLSWHQPSVGQSECTDLRDIHSMKPRRAEGMMTVHKFRRETEHKLRVLKHAEAAGDVGKACRYFGVGHASFYRWRAVFQQHGVADLEKRPSGVWHGCQTDGSAATDVETTLFTLPRGPGPGYSVPN